MGYSMTEWQTGDVVTEEKINNMELGIYNNDTFKSTGYILEMVNDGANPTYIMMNLRDDGIETLLADLNGGASFLAHLSGETESFGTATSNIGIDPSDYSIAAEDTFIVLSDTMYTYDRIENNALIFISQTTPGPT